MGFDEVVQSLELVGNERAEYMVPERDVDALAGKLTQMIERPKL